ncbi:MAG TPA: hypothetical protein ENJ20_02480 [Bacteroidetes bacterium]|nr:hypothetical protein [Bacteroidota bacterium]
MKNYFFFLLGLLLCQGVAAQDIVYQTFKDRWIINTMSVETLPKNKLDIRIAHRFGDMGGEAGGWATFYGLENASDVSIGAEYGLSDRLTLGVNRSKGAGSLRQLLNAFLKYKLLEQQQNGRPVSLVVVGMASLSTSQRSNNPASMTYFANFAHRMVYHGAVMAGRKFSGRFSLQLTAGLTHRNVVPNDQQNNTLHIGLASRIQVTKILSIISDFALPFIEAPTDSRFDHHPPLGIGLEIDTGGHIFQVNLTNANGIMPTDYIPYTFSDWGKGQFRLGFTISRMFNL